MASTHPSEFARLSPLLPAQSDEKKALVERLLSRQLRELEALRSHYPHILAAMRRLHTAEDTPEETSLETYQRGEMYTWSMETLTRFARQTDAMPDYGLTILQDMARQYGFATLEALEQAMTEAH